jgi:starvation-inducible DNA-binding protein
MLAEQLKVLLGSTFVLYTKTHGFHWNIEGSNFPQYHKFLLKTYENIYETIDVVAEYIRTLDVYTPETLARMLELSVIKEQPMIPRAELMLKELLADSKIMTDLVTEIFDVATEANAQGIANYMAELQDLYTKLSWMLTATLKTQRE